jgi:hypothetical protein
MKKSEQMPVRPRKWFFSCIFAESAEAGEKCSKAQHLLERRVIIHNDPTIHLISTMEIV